MDLAGKRIVVMGLGRFGGGVGVTRFLVRRGARVLVTDLLPAAQLQASLGCLSDLPGDQVEYRLGGHDEKDFRTADLIVVNPAVDPRNNAFLRAAAAVGVPTTSEIRLFVAHLPRPREQTIAVTGTAGKSTTTAMIGHILETAASERQDLNSAASERQVPRPSRVWVGGNLGGSLLDNIEQIGPDDWVVLELSSFMLEDMRTDRWSPQVAVVTNLSDNHLDRHETMRAYAAAKQVILDFQTPDAAAVLGPGLEAWMHPRCRRVLRVREPAAGLGELLIPGAHNRLNATFAVGAAMYAGVDPAFAAAALADFRGLPHRLQLVAERGGVRYYNDSKATTPAAAELALTSFPPGQVHIILGGYDKHADLSGVAKLARRHGKAIYTLGATGDAIAAAAEAAPGGAAVVRCGALDRAMGEIRARVGAGDVVLLSPACASWDRFENYEQRGEQFARLAQQG